MADPEKPELPDVLKNAIFKIGHLIENFKSNFGIFSYFVQSLDGDMLIRVSVWV
jgi:hypothetical protein